MSSALFVALRPPLERAAVLRCLDYPPQREPPPRIAAMLLEAMEEARSLLAARGAWRALEPLRAGEVGLAPLQAEGLALGLVTLGPALEARVAALQAEGSPTRALLLDACGSAAAEEAADRLSAVVVEQLGAEGGPGASVGAPGCRLSPGFGAWALEHQPALLATLAADRLGVSLSPGFMMAPRKSISFAMWLGARGRPVEGLLGCRACGLRRCRYQPAA